MTSGGQRESVVFVYLAGDFDTIWRRMETRAGHYMKSEVLADQFAALELPRPDKATTVQLNQSIEEIVSQISQAIDRQRRMK